jgi:hypothetical protein
MFVHGTQLGALGKGWQQLGWNLWTSDKIENKALELELKKKISVYLMNI